MIGDKSEDCREMFRHACAFCECADMAFEKFKHDTADIAWYTTPAVVNSAFACEVFSKALMEYYNISVKKAHGLKDMYEKFPQELQDWIKIRVLNNYGSWENMWGFPYIDNISDAFVKWRYHYEHDWNKSASMYIETGFLTVYRDVLREACCQLFFNKSWEQYKN
ncbi:MAG: hypothetical protein IJ362_05605 [Oscillospiraceae bacterium]|nr:hypothetical protein [Oscillospiraceae bacterium]